MPGPLPEFARPPIDEVVIGVQFEPLAELHAAHLGIYWSLIRKRYPTAEEQVPLPPQMELETPAPPLPIAIRPGPLFPRHWFLDPTKNELIQVQRDRFLRNWRQITGNEGYPRFHYLIAKFKEEWEGFQDFLEQERLGPTKVNQCELSYVNHLEPGHGWKDYSELDNVFTHVRALPEGFLPKPEIQSWESRFKLPDGKGRMHVEAQPMFRARDFKLVLSLALTVRGSPGLDAKTEAVLAWFEMAHEWIVRGFAQLTHPTMHALWERK
jgi:uncharacterized protein (TIGR04255 family)